MKKLALLFFLLRTCTPAMSQHVEDTTRYISGEVIGVVNYQLGTFVAVQLDGCDKWVVYGSEKLNADPEAVVSEGMVLKGKYAADLFPLFDDWKYAKSKDLEQ